MQITFHYTNGQEEAYLFQDPIQAERIHQEAQQSIRRLMDKPWLIFHLPDQTVMVNMANVLKIELKPAIAQLHGEDVFADAQRVTALTRSYRE
jgi:hypothetical protein